eukprot:COSAG06_NODE_2761_length_6333_cov_5.558196_5_plen_59_part_00
MMTCFGAGIGCSLLFIFFVLVPMLNNLDLIKTACRHTKVISAHQEMLCEAGKSLGVWA